MSKEIVIRLSFFIGILALIAIWELLAPRRSLTTSKTGRWLGNLAVIFLNAGVVAAGFDPPAPPARVDEGIIGSIRFLIIASGLFKPVPTGDKTEPRTGSGYFLVC